MLDAKTLSAIAKQIHHQFPEVAGSKPTVRIQNPPQAKNTSPTREHTSSLYLVTFRGTGNTSAGKSIPRLVRVVVTVDGKIIKITTSR
jgi:hypothetical protein